MESVGPALGDVTPLNSFVLRDLPRYAPNNDIHIPYTKYPPSSTVSTVLAAYGLAYNGTWHLFSRCPRSAIIRVQLTLTTSGLTTGAVCVEQRCYHLVLLHTGIVGGRYVVALPRVNAVGGQDAEQVSGVPQTVSVLLALLSSHRLVSPPIGAVTGSNSLR